MPAGACYCLHCYHQKGVDYYGQVHTTTQNVIAHVVGMPFTIYGILITVPTLLMCTEENAWQVQIGLFILYLGHYLRIEFDTVVSVGDKVVIQGTATLMSPKRPD